MEKKIYFCPNANAFTYFAVITAVITGLPLFLWEKIYSHMCSLCFNQTDISCHFTKHLVQIKIINICIFKFEYL